MNQFIENELLDHFLEALRALPSTEVKTIKAASEIEGAKDLGVDAVVRAKLGAVRVVFLIGIKRVVYPRDVREMLRRITAVRISGLDAAEHPMPFLISEEISKASREMLRTANCGYFQEGGSLHISPTSGAYVLIDKPRKAKSAVTGSATTIFRGVSPRVLHFLLDRPEQWKKASDIAEATGIADSTVSRIFMRLEKIESLDTRGIGPQKERRLKNPKQILDAWAEDTRNKPPSIERFFVPGLSANDVSTVRKVFETFRLKEVPALLTHEVASQLYAPFLTTVASVRCRVSRPNATREVLRILGAKPVPSGFNFAFILVKTDHDLFHGENLSMLPLASKVQVYLDLISSEGRAREAAEHLRSTAMEI